MSISPISSALSSIAPPPCDPAFTDMLAAVRRHGTALEFASDALKDNFDIVLAAVQQNGRVLQYASARLRQDPSLQVRVHDITRAQIRQNAYFPTSLERIQQEPLKVLQEIAKFPTLPHVGYIDSPGIDAGGLRRDFITRLMQALYAAEDKPLPTDEIDSLLIPQTVDLDKDQRRSYQALGALFSLVLQHKESTIGTYFHPVFFQMLRALTQQDVQDSPVNFGSILSPVVDKLFRIYAKEILHFSQAADGSLSLPFDEEFSAREDFYSDTFKQLALAIVTIKSGCYQHHRLFDTLQGADGAALMTFLQGNAVDKDSFFEAIDWEHPITTDREKNATTFYHFVQWLQEASQEEVADLIWTITGSTTLRPGGRLAIGFRSENQRLPTYHTCFSSMDLPNGYPNYATFKSKLETSIKEGLTGIQLS